MTDAVDQAALSAFWKGLTSKGTLNWNTATSLCHQTGVTCDTGGMVTAMYGGIFTPLFTRMSILTGNYLPC